MSSLPAITLVSPRLGSRAGQTRLTITGRNFANSSSAVNDVRMNGQVCATIPLHSTENQIVCKTPPWVPGSSEWATITVTVDGIHADCHTDCRMRYRSDRTLSVDHVFPPAAPDGTLLWAHGTFNDNFDIDVLLQPKREVPPLAVVIEDPALSHEFEPLGPGGTRCGLIDPDTEEMYRQFDRDDLYCVTGSGHIAGYYNFSVTQDGEYGGAQLEESAMLTNAAGQRYSFQQLASITDIEPVVGSAAGGTRITITGASFPNDASRVTVLVGEELCDVSLATISRIECTLRHVTRTYNASTQWLVGNRGVMHQHYEDETAWTQLDTKVPTYTSTEPVFYTPWTTAVEHRYSSKLAAWWTVPWTGTYSLVSNTDDVSRTFMGSSPEDMTEVIYQRGAANFYDWFRRSDSFSARMYLTAGSRYYLEQWSSDYGGELRDREGVDDGGCFTNVVSSGIVAGAHWSGLGLAVSAF